MASLCSSLILESPFPSAILFVSFFLGSTLGCMLLLRPFTSPCTCVYQTCIPGSTINLRSQSPAAWSRFQATAATGGCRLQGGPAISLRLFFTCWSSHLFFLNEHQINGFLGTRDNSGREILFPSFFLTPMCLLSVLQYHNS